MVIQPSYKNTIKGIGYTEDKRFLVVIYKEVDLDKILIITAYPAKKKHILKYAKLTGGLVR